MAKYRALGVRLLCVLLCLCCVGAMLLPAKALPKAPAAPREKTMTTAVYRSASYFSKVMGQMENGTPVKVLSSYRGFYKVDCYDMSCYVPKEQVKKENGKYFIDCKEDSLATQQMEYYTQTEAVKIRKTLLRLADKQLGTRYAYGGTKPGGFDCSGFMLYLYKQHGVVLNRTSSNQISCGIVVAKEGMQPGDLVFFRERGSREICTHVGMYVGNNTIIHSSTKGIVYAKLDLDWFLETYLCARRIINTKAAQIQDIPPLSVFDEGCVSQSVSGRTAH